MTSSFVLLSGGILPEFVGESGGVGVLEPLLLVTLSFVFPAASSSFSSTPAASPPSTKFPISFAYCAKSTLVRIVTSIRPT